MFTKERLDRAFGNMNWTILFEITTIRVLFAQTLDNSPLLIFMGKGMEVGRSKRKLFRYEASWSEREDCYKIVKAE